MPHVIFNSHVSITHDSAEFGAALCLEMSYMADLPDHRALTSIFWRGTPSLMPAVVGKIIAHAEKKFGFAPAIEITAEAIQHLSKQGHD